MKSEGDRHNLFIERSRNAKPFHPNRYIINPTIVLKIEEYRKTHKRDGVQSIKLQDFKS
jgi:hypothetical protein